MAYIERWDWTMHTVVEILEAASRLTEVERRRLVEALRGGGHAQPIEQRHRDALSSWLGLAGTFHSDVTDVSTDKYRHVSNVYADER